jgi:hypothetical protein
LARAPPVSVGCLEQRKFDEMCSDVGMEFRLTEDLGQDRWRHQHLPVFEGTIENGNIRTRVVLQERHPRARVRGNHRSAFSSATLRENRTLPLIDRNWE